MNFWLGETDRMRDLQLKAGRIAGSYLPVLIEGETGTGKERLAQHFHELRAAGGSLVKYPCDSSPSRKDGSAGGEPRHIAAEANPPAAAIDAGAVSALVR